MYYPPVPSITTRRRPDEYLVEMRKTLGIMKNTTGANRGGNYVHSYGEGYYRFRQSPNDQDPRLVLKRAVKEFITSPSTSDSKTLAIEYLPYSTQKKGFSADKKLSKTIYLSKRYNKKIIKNTIQTPTIIGRDNPF